MNLKLTFEDFSCDTEIFEINGKKAKHEDFGEKSRIPPDPWEDPMGCGGIVFSVHPKNSKYYTGAVERYGITEKEWDEICDKLQKGLSIGPCGLCI